MRHYLDHAATTPMRPAAREAWLEASHVVGNASSLHASGRSARSLLEDARDRVAAALGAHPTEVIFTSGGTEANNLAIKGGYWARRALDADRARVVTTAVEHHSALDPGRWIAAEQGGIAVELPVDADAHISLDALAAELEMASTSTCLVSIQSVNNEVGAVQPVAKVVALAAAHGIPVHSDAVQAIGHVPFDFANSGLATAAVSSHKVGGPVAAGALLARRDAALSSLTHGGGQERRVRSGTVDVAAAWAFAVAIEEAVGGLDAEAARLAALGDRLAHAITAASSGAVVHGPSHGAPHIVHAIIPGASSEALLVALDLAGVEVSPGAACTAGVVEPSHVVLAMGRPPAEALSTVRFSLGWNTTDADVDAAIAALPGAIAHVSR
ncbi:cysteine desulfurase [Demequina sp. TTPB684]|uniref:cysteine desulfurase family protein n=1 Tax=unclassified Demequina TaxID=2620311 RepID=UPI001CF4B936|nr:cysteine desulfurase family protein [Demequina sp. TMPB413]MCB2413980.1 cysteine desulfurase [Demequina sp. TTPB684]UPU88667.1 cysteine desulfurase [Demequina sp. TMPB413]